MDTRLTVDLAQQALTMALQHRTSKTGLLQVGSGHPVCCHELPAARPQRHRGEYVMPRELWDNACVERFFGRLKRELIHHHRCRMREEAKRDIFEYIEVFYNRLCRHSTLGYYFPG